MVTFNYVIWWGLVGIHQRMAAVLLEPFPTPLLGLGGFGIQSPDRDRAGIFDLGRNKSPFATPGTRRWGPKEPGTAIPTPGTAIPELRDRCPRRRDCCPWILDPSWAPKCASELPSLDFWTPKCASGLLSLALLGPQARVGIPVPGSLGAPEVLQAKENHA